MKISVEANEMSRLDLMAHAELCGWALARAHAKSGQAAQISGYLGQSDKFDEVLADFATQYSRQNAQDFLQFKKALRTGKL
jgi:hypothetical protein